MINLKKICNWLEKYNVADLMFYVGITIIFTLILIDYFTS